MKPLVSLMVALACIASAASVAANPLAPGWDLDAQTSALSFQSIKNNIKVESSSFASFDGHIEADGSATLRILLDSVDTGIDLRNVRMRFLFFETFQHPQAQVSVQIDPADVADLGTVRRKVLTLPFTLSLHGVERSLTARAAVTLLADDMLSVTTFEPIGVDVADFDLTGGLEKLEEAAGVDIVPSASVTFNLLFRRRAEVSSAPADRPAATPNAAALEPQGAFSEQECAGRFEILSRTDSIQFGVGSAQLEASSSALLDAIVDIVSRCPALTIEVSGHTDSDGSAAANQQLSEARARAVTAYLTGAGVDAARIVSAGYGETRPVVPNTSARNKRRNRRIEFALVR